MEKLGRSERYNRKVAAVTSSDWDRIQKAHTEEAQALTDNSVHLKARPAPESYTQMLASGQPQSGQPTPANQNTPKMLHDVADEEDTHRMMTKPYHPGIQRNTRHWVEHPIQGWATMASRSVYDAAGLEDISEEVYAHSHQEVPVTVHKFAPGYDTIFAAQKESSQWGAPIQRAIDPLQVQQIGIMDFLMGNMDRHDMNLMVSNTKNEQGFFPLLAVDHNNNFQYIRHLNEIHPSGFERKTYDSPADYLNRSALRVAKEASPTTSDPTRLRDWWAEHAEEIKTSFDAELEHIRDVDIKSHVKKNFDRRFSMVQMWAMPGEEGSFENMSFFSNDFPHVIRNIPKAKTAPNIIEKIVGVLPKANPARAIKMLASALKGKRSPAIKQKLSDTFDMLIEQMDTNQLVQLYDEHRKDYDPVSRNRSLGFHILEQVAHNDDRATAKALLDYDQGRGKLPVFWAKRLRGMIGIKDEEKEAV